MEMLAVWVRGMGDANMGHKTLEDVVLSVNDDVRHPRRADRYPEGGRLILLACESKLAGAADKSTTTVLDRAVESMG